MKLWGWWRSKPKGYWKLVEPYWDAVSIYDGPEVFLSQFAAIPKTSQHLLAAHWAQSEISNGGLDQFFTNSTGVLGPEAVAGFRAIGMPQTADVLARVFKGLGEPYPRDRDARWEALDRFDETPGPELDFFNAADPIFFKLLTTEKGGFDLAADRFAAEAGVEI